MSARAHLLPVVVLPQCEAYRETVYSNDHSGVSKVCRRNARYSIDGYNLCLKHAEMTALRILMAEKDDKSA